MLSTPPVKRDSKSHHISEHYQQCRDITDMHILSEAPRLTSQRISIISAWFSFVGLTFVEIRLMLTGLCWVWWSVAEYREAGRQLNPCVLKRSLIRAGTQRFQFIIHSWAVGSDQKNEIHLHQRTNALSSVGWLSSALAVRSRLWTSRSSW